MNVGPLVESVLRYYGPYVHEIVMVNDGSRDRTAEVTMEIARQEPRVRLVNRTPPNGVGRALGMGMPRQPGDIFLRWIATFCRFCPNSVTFSMRWQPDTMVRSVAVSPRNRF